MRGTRGKLGRKTNLQPHRLDPTGQKASCSGERLSGENREAKLTTQCSRAKNEQNSGCKTIQKSDFLPIGECGQGN